VRDRSTASRLIPAGALVCLLAAVGAPVLAAPERGPSPSDRTGPAALLEATRGRTLLRLEPGAPIEWEAAVDPRYRRVRLAGFGSTAVAGAPGLPVWVGWVAIPEGANPVLRIVRSRPVPVPGVRPLPVPTHDILHLPEDGSPPRPGVDVVPVLLEDPAYYAGTARYPSAPVRLGKIGTFRRQRYVEILYYPLAYDPVEGTVVRFADLVVEVLHASRETAPARPAVGDSSWEPLYRQAFVNDAVGPAMRSARARATGPWSQPARESAESACPVGSPSFKVKVDADGVHRIDHPTLQAAAPSLVAADPTTWHLCNRGLELPIRILGEGDGSFDPGDILEFYGEARREPDMVLEVDMSPQPSVYRETDVGGTNVYLLSASGAPGSGARVATRDASPDPVTPLPAEPDFVSTVRFEQETVLLPLGGDDGWYWGPRTNSLGTDLRAESLDLPGLASATLDARVRATLRGTTSLSAVPEDHLARFNLNGTLFPDLGFDGESVGTFDTQGSGPGFTLADPFPIEITALPVFDGPTELVNEFLLNRIEVTYRRSFDSLGSNLGFEFADGDYGFAVSGLPDAFVVAYELTDPDPVRLDLVSVSAGPPYTASFEIHPTGAGIRSFLVTTGGLALAPTAIEVDTASSLADPSNGAGYVIVTHPDLIDASPGSAFDQFVAQRESEGLPVAVAFVDDIYDEFSNSLPDPEAIRDFLAHAYASWTGWDADADGSPDAPRYVLFIGDGSVDFRQRLSYNPPTTQSWFNKVPTAIFYRQSAFISWYSSDNWLAAVDGGDLMPDILVGRLSTRSASETEAALAKVLAYEGIVPPAGAWASHAVFLACKGNSPFETDDFESIAADLEADFVAPPFTSSHL